MKEPHASVRTRTHSFCPVVRRPARTSRTGVSRPLGILNTRWKWPVSGMALFVISSQGQWKYPPTS